MDTTVECPACGAAARAGQRYCADCGSTLTTAGQDARRIGPYVLHRELGRGGMGAVHEAFDERLGRRVALKVLLGDLAQDVSFRSRFLRESRAAAALDHPNILPVFDAGEADGVLYIASRLVDGMDLRETLSRDGPFGPDRALAVIGQIAAALDAAHAKGIVHRDVKPANVLLVPAGDEDDVDHAYLIDFGVTADPGREQRLTATGHFVGTAEYVAPEQISEQPVDGRADQYALACALHECLTGAPPFQGSSVVEVLHAHLHREPPTIPMAGGNAVNAALAQAMAKDPAERHASCRAFVAAARRPAPTLPRTAPAGADEAPTRVAPTPPPASPRAAARTPTPARSPAAPRAPTPARSRAVHPPTRVAAPAGPLDSGRGSSPPPRRRRGALLAGLAVLAALVVAAGVVVAITLTGGDGDGSSTRSTVARTTPTATRSTPRPDPDPTTDKAPLTVPRLDVAGLPVRRYTLDGYRVDLPSDWKLVRRDEPQNAGQTRRRTEAVDHAGGLSVLIDAVPGYGPSPEATRAAGDDSSDDGKPAYRRVGFEDFSEGVTQFFEWRYRFAAAGGEQARRVDVFFNQGGALYAVLASGTAAFDDLSALARRVAVSLDDDEAGAALTDPPTVGTYTGVGVQQDLDASKPGETVRISMRFEEEAATISYPGLECRGTLTPDGTDGAARVFAETITSGTCDKHGRWNVVTDGDALHVVWAAPDHTYRVEADLGAAG